MAQLVISAVGAVVGGVAGYFVGGPAGAVQGAEIGFALGGIAGSFLIHQKGPQPGDLRIMDSAYGKPIPISYGMFRLAGNVIWAAQPVVNQPGKGGKGTHQTTVTMSFACALCEGPIEGVRRVWANGKLIYDISNPSDFQAISGSNQMANFSLYYGDETQTADPTMQGALGAANVPAYRGLAYVVFHDLDLSPWGNYLPSFTFEVVVGVGEKYYSAKVSDYTYTTAIQTNWGMPYLTANGGTAVGFGYYFGYHGIQAVSITPYGATPGLFSTPLLTPSGTYETPRGNSDYAGILADNGYGTGIAWWNEFGKVGASYDISALRSGPGAVASFSFWKNGSDLFFASEYTTGGPVVRCDFLTGAALAVSTISGAFAMIGGSASYVYVTDGHTMYRLNRNTLAVVASWSNTFAAYIGYVFDDDHIYFCSASSGATTVYLFQPSSNTVTSYGSGPNFGANGASSMAVINPNYIVFSSSGDTFTVQLGYMWLGIGNTTISLATVVGDLCNRAGLLSSQYDVSALASQLVHGYAVTNHSATRSNLSPLMAAYFFDACDSDAKIKFIPRGGSPVATVAFTDLGASSTVGDQQNQTPISEVIQQEIDFPRSLSLTYVGLTNDYNPATQRAFRSQTRSNKDSAMQAPLVFPDGEALERVQAMFWAAWVGRKTFAFSTRLGYLAYEPGDVMTLQGGNGQTYTVRLMRCQYDGQGSLIWTASLEQPNIYPNGSYTAQGGESLGFKPQTLDYSGPTLLAVLDCPPLRDVDDAPGLYMGACGYAASWPGCAVDVSRDSLLFTDLVHITSPSAIGYTTAAPGNFLGGNQPDELNSIGVTLISGTLSSVSYANFLAGVNAAYFGGELIYFRNATLTGPNTYVLTGLLRGRVGTEWAMASHNISEQFVFLDPSKIASMPIATTDIGATLYFEPHLLNLFGGQPVTPQSAVPAIARIKPLSPALFVAGHGSDFSGSDISLSWLRRARVFAQWNDGADVPLDESAETYTLNIYSGGTLKRTVTISAMTTYLYSAANITADGFTAGNVITFTVQQNSDQGVIGYAATTTIAR